jgi:hypothetical protein
MFIRKHHYFGLSLLILLTLLFTACESTNSTSNTLTNTPLVSMPTSITPSPQARRGPQPCPQKQNSPGFWNNIINPVPGNTVYLVSCGYLLGDSSLQAVVADTCDCSGGFINVYVYTDITTNPRQLLGLEHLEHGDAKISNYNTVLSAQVDEQSSINKNTSCDACLQADWFREFRWNQQMDVMQQVSFPGMFPDLTRYQAEYDQSLVKQGHDPWKLSATDTARAFTVSLLKWHTNAQAILISGGGPTDTSAKVQVKNSASDDQDPIIVTLDRLEGNIHGGIWIVTAAANPFETITHPQSEQTLSSPALVLGNAQGTNGTAGTIAILDHLYTNIGQLVVQGTNGLPQQPINAPIKYNSSLGPGLQEEGIVMLYDTVNFDGSIVHAILVKVLLEGNQGG